MACTDRHFSAWEGILEASSSRPFIEYEHFTTVLFGCQDILTVFCAVEFAEISTFQGDFAAFRAIPRRVPTSGKSSRKKEMPLLRALPEPATFFGKKVDQKTKIGAP